MVCCVVANRSVASATYRTGAEKFIFFDFRVNMLAYSAK